MIKLSFGILFLLLTHNLYSQITGSQFAPNGTRWSTEAYGCFPPPNCFQTWRNFRINGDTIINNKYYQKIDTSVSYIYDTTCLKYSGRNFYYHNKQLFIDTFLVCDFNLNEGDTFNVYVDCACAGHNGYYKMPVDSVDSLYYGNKWRKRITFKKMNGFYFGPVRWVEGIGDIDYGFDIFLPPTYTWFYGGVETQFCVGGYERLNCFQEPVYAAYGNYCYNGLCTTGINDYLNEKQIKVYPNPASDKVYIEMDKNIKTEISLYDIYGREIKSTEKKEMDVRNFKDGIYFVRIVTDKGTAVKKIVISK